MNYEEFKERVRSGNDIVDVIGRYVDLKKSGANYKGLCPFHNEKTPSFFVMQDGQFYYCHGCHKGGDVFKFLCEYNHMDFPDAVRELAETAGIDVPDKFDYGDAGRIKAGLKNRLRDMYKTAAEFYYKELHSGSGKKALDYLKDRGLTKNTMVAFGLGYAPAGRTALYDHLKGKDFTEEELKESGLFSYKTGGPKDAFFDRVMFPIMNRASKVIAFGGRILGTGDPKYINSPETPIYSKKNNLYGIQRAIAARKERIILVEGYMDVISMHQAGYPETVASLGTALTKEQADIIAKLARKVYLIYDADGPGIQAMRRAIPILKKAGLFVNIVSMKPFKDPDEMIKSEGVDGVEGRIRNADNAIVFELECIASEYDRKDPSENAEFEMKAANMIVELRDRFQREEFIKTVSERFDINKELLTSEVNRIGDETYKEGIIRRKQNPVIRRPEGVGSRIRDGDQGLPDERNVLLALVKNPKIFEQVKGYVSVEDFTTVFLREVADILFDKLNNGGTIQAGEIMSRFDNEEQSDLGRLFSNEMYDASDDRTKSKFVSESLKSMVMRMYDEKSENAPPDEKLRLMKEKNALSDLTIDINPD